MMSWPASPRMRIRPIGPGSPMRKLGAPRSIFAGGASDRSGKCPSRVWTTSIPLSRAAPSTAAIGFTARASCETSLPSVSPKPPGSMKSRCMSMMTRAVRAQSSSIGAGWAVTVPLVGYSELAIAYTPEPELVRDELSKARAIVYNYAWRRLTSESFINFNWLNDRDLDCLLFIRGSAPAICLLGGRDACMLTVCAARNGGANGGPSHGSRPAAMKCCRSVFFSRRANHRAAHAKEGAL